MKPYHLLLALAILTTAYSCKTLTALGLEPSDQETTAVLKKLLNSSTLATIQKLEGVSQDGIQSLLPAELGSVLASMRTIGLGGDIDKVDRQIQQASLVALRESQGTITDAIKTLRFKDAAAVALGGESAATEVMRQAMYASVKQRYSSQLDGQLAQTEVQQYWPAAVAAYNLFAKNKVGGSMSDFLAERAVDGLFASIGREERDLRNNYQRLGDAAVTRVLDYYGKQQARQ